MRPFFHMRGDFEMYPYEMRNYIDSRNKCLTREELNFILDIKQHPQIVHVKYENNWWYMRDKEGNEFNFTYKCS